VSAAQLKLSVDNDDKKGEARGPGILGEKQENAVTGGDDGVENAG